MADIAINAVSKVYPGNVTAIEGLDLSIPDGELIVLVGPSGCGKSTLLRMIAGLETITDGEIAIGGKVVNNREPAERDIAMVFQNYALYPHMSVRQNLEYGLKNRNTPRSEIDKRVAEASRILEIEPFLERKPRQLSGGQRQRVAMGRAIVREPSAFLFDEPLSNLDAKLRGHMRVEIRRLQKALGTTSVYVTHDQLEAMTLADKLVVMNKGRIEQVGSPIELYERPLTTFVASFIGSPPMNLIEIEHLVQASTNGSLSFIPSRTGLVGIRPDDIRMESSGAGIDLIGDVEMIEHLGGAAQVHVRVQGISEPLVVAIAGPYDLNAETKLRLFLPAASLHCFDQETGKRLE